ncbi:MAG: PAAR domain-containing protein [Polyangiales bacterium]
MADAATTRHQHVCPKVDPVHIGGPVSTGSENVEINGELAARVTDRAKCFGAAGGHDLVQNGSASVEINGLPAARRGDATMHGGSVVMGSPNVEIGGASVRATSQQLARFIASHTNIRLEARHPFGNIDDAANADDVVKDVSEGRRARRSSYDDPGTGPKGSKAPGGSTALDEDMLTGMIDVSKDYQSVNVREISGAEHSGNSQHYNGLAFDVDRIDGQRVDKGAVATAFRQACRDLGASKVYGPGDKHHDHHFHCEWPPRP